MTDYESVTRKPGYWWVCHGDQKQWEVVEVDEQDRIWWPGREQEDWTDGPEVDVWGPYLGRTPNTESQSVARETSTVDGVIYAQHPGSTGDANYRNDGSTAAQTTECKSMGQKATEHGYLRDATLDDFREATRRIARWSGFFYEADYAWEAPHPLHLAELLESSTAPHDAKDTERRSVAPSMGRVVGGFREGATSEGSFVPPKGHYNLVVQVANGSEPCPLYWTDVEIRPKKTDCGSVDGTEVEG